MTTPTQRDSLLASYSASLQRIHKLKSENAALRKALAPFVDYAGTLEGPNWLPDSCGLIADPEVVKSKLTVSHLRVASRIARTLENKQNRPEEK